MDMEEVNPETGEHVETTTIDYLHVFTREAGGDWKLKMLTYYE